MAWDVQVSSTQKLVLISLADQANDDGVCWPSIGSISKRTGLKDRAIRGAIQALQNEGYLQVEKYRGRASNYVVTPARDAALEETEPRHLMPKTPASNAANLAPNAGLLEPSMIRNRNKNINTKSFSESAKNVIDFFNRKCDKHARPHGSSLNAVVDILKAGYSEDDCRAVIVRKNREWGNDDEMKKYIRIGTLFRERNFANYVSEIPEG
jgi:uncharacterized phage protein (TIGR02220 family)